ncbi:DMT family transporter [Mogibacterium pumilum]|uniref:EamA domain-containing protein n=1 Tax=Mogibacterium pumilum TaxID=86332 RepID=A0A223AQ43_9FIRM|nr:DMT family transporter [Mogibacterium pumilum]ASS37075.1 hypothetical protein AXF17_00335 [Mogibacterium pumilum]
MSNGNKGNIALLLAAVIWGSGFIAQKMGMDTIGPYFFNGSRMVIAGLALLPLVIKMAKPKEFFSAKIHGESVVKSRKISLLKGSLVCGFLLAMASSLQQVGLIDVPVGRAGFIIVIYIILVPLLGIFAGHKVELKIWIAVLMAIIGFAMLSLHGGFSNLGKGDVITLLSSLFFAMQIISVSKHVTKNNAIMLSAAQMLVCGVLTLIVAFIVEHTTMEMIKNSLLVTLYSALIPTALAYTMQIIGQKYTNPTLASLLMSLESVFAAILGVLVLNEHMTLVEWGGCAVIFASTVVAQVQWKSPEKSRQDN